MLKTDLAINKRVEDESKKFSIVDFYNKYGVLTVFVCMFILFSIISPVFLKPSNLLNILRQISIIGILAMGMSLVIISGAIDLSQGSVIALVTVLVADALKYGIIAAILVGLLTGAVVGLVNGIGVTYGKLQPFIMTLGTTSMASGLAFIYSKGTPVMIDGPFLEIGNGFLLKVVPLPVVYYLVILIMATLLMRYTVFGRYIYSMGSNKEATRLSGVNINANMIKVYVISGVLAAIAGIIYTSQLGIGTPIAGEGYELKAITSVVVGGASMNGGSGTIVGTFLGTLIIGILGNIMNLTGVNPFVQTFLTGLILVVAVLIRRDK